MFKLPFSLRKKEAAQEKNTPSPTDPFPLDSEAFLHDPYPFYRTLRENHPVYQTPNGFTVISRYKDNITALSDPKLGNSPSRFSTLHASKKEQFACADLANNIMPFLDGPEHKLQRKIIGRLFQKELRRLETELPGLAQKTCELLPSEFEVMTDLATPFTLEAINSLLGFPEDPSPQQWSDLFFYLFTQIPSVELRDQINTKLTEFREWIQKHLRSQNLQGLSAAFREAISENTLSESVAIDTLILLFADGLENVDTGIANSLECFSAHQDQWEKLKAAPSLINSAVDECLRYDPPAQYIARTVLEDFEWQGQTLKKDRQVILLLSSANRDAEVFEEAERFLIDRTPNPHLSFGRGKHSCLGGKLVEKELKAILSSFLPTCRGLERISEIQWQFRKGHRWIESAHYRKN